LLAVDAMPTWGETAMSRRLVPILAGLAFTLVAQAAVAQDPAARSPTLFDLGIYGGGAYTTDWFTLEPSDSFPAQPPGQPSFWLSPTFGARSSEVLLPGAGTVQRGGQEVHILAPGTERATGVSGGFGLSFNASDFWSPVPRSRIYFGYNYSQADGARAARVAPGTDNVAFTLDRISTLSGGGTTTGLFAGALGMDARQQFDINQHRVDAGLAMPIPVGPGTFIFKVGGTLQFSREEYQSSLALITLPDVQMSEVRRTEQQLIGPTLGGAVQLPITLGSGTGGRPSTLFLTAGGDVGVLFGQTTFHSNQALACPVCGPNFPVSVWSSATISNSIFEAGAFFRAAVTVGPRATLFGEVGGIWTERGSFITPANPNQQPLRVELRGVTDHYFRFGGAIAFPPG
jgi:hypothetical protein